MVWLPDGEQSRTCVFFRFDMIHEREKIQISLFFYHIFYIFPRDTHAAITLNVVWMEREFDAYKLSRSMYPSIFNSFPVIRTASAKTRRFHVPQPTFLFPLGTPLEQSR